MARRFWQEFDKQPKRGYGGSVVAVFKKLKQNLDTNSDPFEPAAQQFDGNGSFGNGAAMRVHPIGLFFPNVETVIDKSQTSAKITHSHCDGVNGAVLQAVATHLALKDFSNEETLKILKKMAVNFETVESKMTYDEQLDNVISMLVSAIESVPTALYAFLKVTAIS